VKNRLVVEAVVANSVVVVALVEVEFRAVKFWRVEEPITRRSPFWFTESLVVEATLRSKRLPTKLLRVSAPMTVPLEERCSTESLAYGVVVPMPTLPVLSILICSLIVELLVEKAK